MNVAGPLIGILRRTARIVISFWPALMAWYLFGVLGNRVIIGVAGWVGAWNFGVGVALMPFAILCRLVAFVAMLLTVRDALPVLTAGSPEPIEPRQRRRQTVQALLAGILPFFAFYFAWGFMRDDMGAFYARVAQVQFARAFENIASDGPAEVGSLGLTLTWLTGTAIVVTFVARRLIKRFAPKSSPVASVIAVYLEALWVMLAGLLVTDLIGSVSSWFRQRQGIAWLTALRDAIAVHVAPLDWLLNVGGWLIGEVGGLILFPLAWLTIAGVIYGQTLSPSSPVTGFLNRGRLGHLRRRAQKVPSWILRRLRDVWADIVGGLRPIGDAFKLMWHAGPLLVAVYVLFFRSVEWLSGQLDIVITSVLGPHPSDFWATYMPAIAVIAPTVTAPLTVGVIGGAYDRVLQRIRPTHPGVASDPVAADHHADPGEAPAATAAP